MLDVPAPASGLLRNQITNSIRPTVVMEMGRSFDVSNHSHIRPFVEARAGFETLVRVGFDLTFCEL